MGIRLKEQNLLLRPLSDDEFDCAERLSRKLDKSLWVCPTCGSKWGDDRPENPTYRLWGEDHPCDCRGQIALYTRYLLANIGEQYMRLDWNKSFDGSLEAREFVDTYLDSWKSFKRHGWGVEFGGPLGVGKTFAATHIGKELIKRGEKVYFISFAEMVAAYEKEDGDEIEDRIRETPYVILDEILPPVSNPQRQLFATKFEAVIRYRTNHNLVTIITTNLGQKDLHENYPRIYSLLAAKQNRIDMSGEDARSSRIPLENLELIKNGEIRPIS